MKIVSAEFIRSAGAPADFLRDGRPEVAFAGRSNVGKSSLLNRLLGRKGLARTSSTPGRTQSVNYFLINGWFYCVDLPGYGFAKAGREARREWALLVDSYLQQAGEHARRVLLVDAQVGATDSDLQAHAYLRDLGAPVTVVATKIDRLRAAERRHVLTAIQRSLGLGEATEVIPFSARTGDGVRELWQQIGPYRAAGTRGEHQARTP